MTVHGQAIDCFYQHGGRPLGTLPELLTDALRRMFNFPSQICRGSLFRLWGTDEWPCGQRSNMSRPAFNEFLTPGSVLRFGSPITLLGGLEYIDARPDRK